MNYKMDFQNIRFGGSGLKTGNLSYVYGGCNATDYSKFIAGNIALIDRGYLLDCSMIEKFANAKLYNAIALVMIHDPNSVGLFGSGLTELNELIGFSVTNQLGTSLTEIIPFVNLTATLFASNAAPNVTTMNVLAETKEGDPNNVIVVGSHLDSVLEGPGINDDGSGSSTNLELAIQLYKSGTKITNKVRFGWWAAEELGLLGSKYYVSSLNSTQISQIALNLNFDMLGSPNFFYGIYNGSSAVNESIRASSAAIEGLFKDYFNSKNLSFLLTTFDGRSDYGPFINVGIPAGGLFTGAEVMKTPEQRTLFGGFANTAFDPCYHQACDTVQNINQEALLINAEAAQVVLLNLATQTDVRKFLNSTNVF